MKIRQGFVSNSSSSSFIILLPKNFNIKKIDWDKYQEKLDEQEVTKKDCIELFNELVSDNGLYENECKNAYYILINIFRDEKLIADELDVDSGRGMISILNRNKIEEMLKR